ncbi:MAG: hypothetical protein ABL985_06590 [Casimicrobium sp.]
MTSPFVTHRAKILGKNSTAAWYRQLLLAMYSGSAFPVGLSPLSSLDHEHAGIAIDLLSSYRLNGENDQASMDLAVECIGRHEADLMESS